MFPAKTKSQGTIQVANDDYLPILVKSFLIDRRTQGLSGGTIEFCRKKLKYFTDFCESQSLTQVTQLTSDFLRQYISLMQENHNPGGVHALFRALRAFLYWVEEEEIIPDWKNPMRKLKAPRVAIEPIVPVSLEDVTALLKTCKRGMFTGERDRSVLLTLLDTGVRAGEFCRLNLDDIDLGTGAIMIIQGKGRKPRVVFIGRRTRRAIRAYLRKRRDDSPALWVTRSGERMTYWALTGVMERRAKLAGIQKPSPHDFRRAFALEMLRNGADVFSLQKLMGHADLQILRRYLAQSDQDTQRAHSKGGPVDNM